MFMQLIIFSDSEQWERSWPIVAIHVHLWYYWAGHQQCAVDFVHLPPLSRLVIKLFQAVTVFYQPHVNKIQTTAISAVKYGFCHAGVCSQYEFHFCGSILEVIGYTSNVLCEKIYKRLSLKIKHYFNRQKIFFLLSQNMHNIDKILNKLLSNELLFFFMFHF